MSSSDPVCWVTVYPAEGGEVEASDKIVSLSFEDDEKKMDILKLGVDNFDLSNFDSPVWKTGNRVEASWGYPGNMAPARSMIITKVTGGRTLQVEANDPSLLMHKVAHKRFFPGPIKRSQVVEAIAEENGFGPDQRFIDDSETFLDDGLAAPGCTDAGLLKMMAKRQGFQFYVDFDGLHWHARKLGQTPLRTFVYYSDLRGDIISWNLENDVFGKKAGGMQAQGRNPITKKDIDVKADNTTTPTPALAPEKIIITGIDRRDGHVTGDTVQPAKPAVPAPKQQGTQAVVRTTEPDEKGAQNVINGAYASNQLAAAELTIECRGDPRTIAKTIVTVLGIGKSISGNYYVTSVNHKVGNGYTMTVKCKRDGRTSINNAAAYEGTNKGATGGVPAKGPVNDVPAPAGPPPAGNAPPPPPLLTPINRRNGQRMNDTGGRSQQATPPAQQSTSSNSAIPTLDIPPPLPQSSFP